MDFLETPTFPVCPGFGYTADPTYSVTHIQRAGGAERSNLNWSEALRRFSFSVGPREEEFISELIEFYHAVGGTAGRFRFKDHSDFKSCHVDLDPTSIDQPLVLAAGVSPESYQLTKRYTAGALTRDRRIKKPVSGTILISDNAVLKAEGSDYTIDYTTGLVLLNFAPAGTLRWGGEFDVPCRFESTLPVEILEQEIQSADVALIEVRL